MSDAVKQLSVVKRDGSIVPFDASRIKEAIHRAFKATNEVDYIDLATGMVTSTVTSKIVADSLSGTNKVTIEQIQDMVEDALMSSGFSTTAKAYILYRDQRRQIRDMKSLVSQNLIDAYLDEADWRIKENANAGFSLQGMNNYLVGALAAEYWLEKIYLPEVRDAHKNGDLHLHDLGITAPYCMGWDLHQLIAEGFNGVPGYTEAAPPKHFRSALGQVYNFLYTLQGEAAGAQAFSNFDTYLAPFIRADNLNYEQVKQALQETVFNLNTSTRVGGQCPFTNVTLDLKVPEFMASEPVIIGGKAMPYSYEDCQEEMSMFNKAFAEVLYEGDAGGRGFTFPIPTYNVGHDFPWGTPEVTAIFRTTAKYGSPYFANFMNSDMRPEDVRSMCCRLRLDTSQLLRRGGGLFGANPKTGSVGVVTLNLSRIGYLAKDEDDFFDRLAKVAGLAVTALEVKRKTVERFAGAGLYPFTSRYLRDVKRRFGKLFANHFSTIGVVGGNEMCLNLLGVSVTHPDGQKFTGKVLDFLQEFCCNAQKRTGSLYNLEATPAEGCSYRLAKIDKERFPNIIVANEKAWKEGATPYYTNSTLPPVDMSDDIFEVLHNQDKLQVKYTGGTVVHVWVGETSPDPIASAVLVKHIFENYELPYLSLTPTYSVCPTHGYVSGKHDTCPNCGAECEVYSRVVGYYRPIKRWNAGKQAEFRDRKTFDKSVLRGD